MLVDLQGTRPLSTDDLEVMTRFLAEYRTELAGGRAAILVNDDVDLGMGRMTQLRSRLEIPNTTIRAFRSYAEAVLWLTTSDNPERIVKRDGPFSGGPKSPLGSASPPSTGGNPAQGFDRGSFGGG